jgi:2'-5' RNA ligase
VKGQRLFIACPVPEDVRTWVRDEVPRNEFEGARWTPSENQHLTLTFLGNTPAEKVEDVVRVCSAAAKGFSAAHVSLAGLGVFPTLRRARVLWVGLRDSERLLERLERDLSIRLAELGWPREDRSFTPHLTVARFRTPQRLEGLPELPEEAPGFEVDSFGLYRSFPSPQGSRYEIVERFPLALRA